MCVVVYPSVCKSSQMEKCIDPAASSTALTRSHTDSLALAVPSHHRQLIIIIMNQLGGRAAATTPHTN